MLYNGWHARTLNIAAKILFSSIFVFCLLFAVQTLVFRMVGEFQEIFNCPMLHRILMACTVHCFFIAFMCTIGFARLRSYTQRNSFFYRFHFVLKLPTIISTSFGKCQTHAHTVVENMLHSLECIPKTVHSKYLRSKGT